ncbi:hypothetical protein SNE40_002963 [Patella caerulea]|uniref:SWIM-type domain-containing protein n=1 Tax=Patella caerulea TaxID=87958 RepID=A0AAN8K749_PATCE
MAAVLSLSDVPSDFSSRYLPYIPSLRQKQRATAFSKGSYIKSMSILAGIDVTSIHVFARIYRSMKKSDEPHQTSIDVNIEDRTITDALCSCKAGMGGRCAHVLAIIIMIEEWKIAGYKDVPSQPSSASLPQQWDKPRGSKIEPDPVSHIRISRPGNVNRKRKPVMANFNYNRKIQVSDADILHLQTLKDSPISYLVSSTADSITTPIGPQLIAYWIPTCISCTPYASDNRTKSRELR